MALISSRWSPCAPYTCRREINVEEDRYSGRTKLEITFIFSTSSWNNEQISPMDLELLPVVRLDRVVTGWTNRQLCTFCTCPRDWRVEIMTAVPGAHPGWGRLIVSEGIRTIGRTKVLVDNKWRTNHCDIECMEVNEQGQSFLKLGMATEGMKVGAEGRKWVEKNTRFNMPSINISDCGYRVIREHEMAKSGS